MNYKDYDEKIDYKSYYRHVSKYEEIIPAEIYKYSTVNIGDYHKIVNIQCGTYIISSEDLDSGIICIYKVLRDINGNIELKLIKEFSDFDLVNVDGYGCCIHFNIVHGDSVVYNLKTDTLTKTDKEIYKVYHYDKYDIVIYSPKKDKIFSF